MVLRRRWTHWLHKINCIHGSLFLALKLCPLWSKNSIGPFQLSSWKPCHRMLQEWALLEDRNIPKIFERCYHHYWKEIGFKCQSWWLLNCKHKIISQESFLLLSSPPHDNNWSWSSPRYVFTWDENQVQAISKFMGFMIYDFAIWSRVIAYSMRHKFSCVLAYTLMHVWSLWLVMYDMIHNLEYAPLYK